MTDINDELKDKITELDAENRSLKAYIKILENNNEVNKCEKQ